MEEENPKNNLVANGHCEDLKRTWLPDVKMSPEGLAALVKASPLGIAALDLNGIVRFWNKAAEAITGWREDEVLGRSLRMLSEERWHEYEEIRRRTLQKESFTSLPVNANKKDGSYMQISYSTAPVFGPENHIAGTVAIFYDITERMKLQTELKASLEKMSRVVD